MLRSQLAGFLIRAYNVNRRAGSIPPEERFRVALARLLLAGPPAELLMLDGPARCPDERATSRLVDALLSYQGTLIVVSNREALLNRLDLDLILILNQAGPLNERTRHSGIAHQNSKLPWTAGNRLWNERKPKDRSDYPEATLESRGALT